MTWLLITIIAYFLLAIVNLTDKVLIDRVLPSSRVYASMVSIMGALVIVVAPWFLIWPGWLPCLLDLGAGAFFVVALWLMFDALKYGDASKITVLIGSLIPVFTLSWSIFFAHELYVINELIGIGLLLVAALVIVIIPDNKNEKLFSRFGLGFLLSVGSAILYAVHFTLIKVAYDNQVFLSAFIWRGIGGGLAGLMFLISPEVRQAFAKMIWPKKLKTKRKLNGNKTWLVVGVQACGAIGFVLQSYAISLKSPAIINALQGVQYVCLFILGWVATKIMPKWFHENYSRQAVIKKTVAIILTAVGIVLLSIS